MNILTLNGDIVKFTYMTNFEFFVFVLRFGIILCLILAAYILKKMIDNSGKK